jgi:ATP-dependent Clp protease ATP-binding subunit ClpB
VLLDEIEKAHPDVFNVLLQVLDDGRLTDGQGRTVDFKNTIVVMTSNYGSQKIQELTEQGAEDWEIEAAVRELIKRGPAGGAEEFGKATGLPPTCATAMTQGGDADVGRADPPELLNRIDEIVVFHQLKRERWAASWRSSSSGCVAAPEGPRDDHRAHRQAKAQLGSEGWDPQFGARPLKRTIQQRIENALASRILSGEFGAGDHILVDYKSPSFVFRK